MNERVNEFSRNCGFTLAFSHKVLGGFPVFRPTEVTNKLKLLKSNSAVRTSGNSMLTLRTNQSNPSHIHTQIGLSKSPQLLGGGGGGDQQPKKEEPKQREEGKDNDGRQNKTSRVRDMERLCP